MLDKFKSHSNKCIKNKHQQCQVCFTNSLFLAYCHLSCCLCKEYLLRSCQVPWFNRSLPVFLKCPPAIQKLWKYSNFSKLTVIFFFYFLFVILFNYFFSPFHSHNLFVNQLAWRLKIWKLSEIYFANLVFYFSLPLSQLLAHLHSHSKLPLVCHVIWHSVLPWEGEIKSKEGTAWTFFVRSAEKARTFLNGIFWKVHEAYMWFFPQIAYISMSGISQIIYLIYTGFCNH